MNGPKTTHVVELRNSHVVATIKSFKISFIKLWRTSGLQATFNYIIIIFISWSYSIYSESMDSLDIFYYVDVPVRAVYFREGKADRQQDHPEAGLKLVSACLTLVSCAHSGHMINSP